MEQPMAQQDQELSCQQVPQQMSQHQHQQQMMLCPIRLVYETPLLMQPGEQMQQNQTIIINPQNPPPWVRPAQNQVIYVHQLPQNNLVPIQQHLDPNQIYLQQNFVNYQQMMPQQIVNHNPQEQIRIPIQLQNVIPSNVIPNNMLQNFQTNIGPNMQNLSEDRTVTHVIPNYDQIQANSGNNTPNSLSNQVNLVPNINNRQIVNSVQAPQTINQNNVASQKPIEMQKQNVYRNVTPQINQQQIIARPQIPQMVMNQVQNIPNVQHIQHITQNFVPNIRQSLQIPPQNVVNNTPHNVQQMFVNALPNVQGPIERTAIATTDANKINNATTVSYNAVRNGQAYTYRAIQPRPVQNRNMPNLLPMSVPTQPLPRPNFPNVNVISSNENNINKTLNKSSTSMIDYMQTENSNVNISRKRKSESPDEIQKKVTVNTAVYGNMIVTAKQGNTITKNVTMSNEVGVNTSPMRRISNKKVVNQPVLLQTKPALPVQTKPVEHPVVKMENNFNKTEILQRSKGVELQLNAKDVAKQIEMDKLLRNTVYTQARGRLINDKQNITNSTNLLVDANHGNVPMNINTDTVKKEDIGVQTTETVMKVKDSATKELSSNMSTKTNDQIVPSKKISAPVNEILKKLNSPIPATCESIMSANEVIVKHIETIKLEETKIKTDDTEIKTENTNVISNAEIVKTEKIIVKSDITKIETTEKALDEADTGKDKTIVKINENINKSNETTNTNIISPKSESTVNLNKNLKDSVSESDNIEPKNRKDYKNLSINDMTNKEIHIVAGNIVKEDRDYVLTHVLDGYVIQESNVPFAIRKPLTEKTLYTNTPSEQLLQEQKQDSQKDNFAKDNRKILELTHLHLNEEKAREKLQIEDNKTTSENDNPFGNLKQAVVKSWTVEDLSSHLSKYNWTETIQILREHEIDGESLFLASKPQLLTIGVNEDHAEAICEFVRT